MLERGLILWLLAISAIAATLPSVGVPAGSNPFLLSVPWLSSCIAVIMFAVGCLLPRDELRSLKSRWHEVISGTAVQYTAMPLLAWLTANLLPVTPDQEIGLILVGCVPGAMASNILTLIARGHVSYSVSLTTAATLLSPIIVPWSLYCLLGHSVRIDPVRVSLDLLMQVAGPVLLGHLLCRMLPTFERLTARIAPTVAQLLVLWVIAVVVARSRAQLLAGIDLLLVALLIINAGGYIAGYSAGWMFRQPEGMRRALTIEIGMQNAGLGATLAGQLFADRPAAAVPPALYAFLCMATGTALAQYWSRRPHGDSRTKTDPTASIETPAAPETPSNRETPTPARPAN